MLSRVAHAAWRATGVGGEEMARQAKGMRVRQIMNSSSFASSSSRCLHGLQRSFHATPCAARKKGILYEFGLLFNRKKREERDQAIKEEVNMGRFPELNELHRTGGKLFDAEDDIIPAALSTSFPELKCFTADGKEHDLMHILRGKVSCVSVFIRDFARPMLKSWEEHIDELKKEYPQLQVRVISRRGRGAAIVLSTVADHSALVRGGGGLSYDQGPDVIFHEKANSTRETP
eukprot:764027-Hanusia_phi.AAC.10